MSKNELKTQNWGSDQKYQLLHILKYFTGSELLHKAALINKTTRKVIQNAGLLTQRKAISICRVPLYHSEHASLLGLLDYLVTVADVIFLGADFFKQQFVMEQWKLIPLIRDVRVNFNREIQLELGGINQLTAIFS